MQVERRMRIGVVAPATCAYRRIRLPIRVVTWLVG